MSIFVCPVAKIFGKINSIVDGDYHDDRSLSDFQKIIFSFFLFSVGVGLDLLLLLCWNKCLKKMF
jgi:hypothetical protein